MSEFKSGGLLPVLVGWSLLITGLLSVLTSCGNNPIIDTPSNNGVDMLASVLCAVIGIFVIKSKSTFTALISGGLAASLLIYANYNVNGEQAVKVVTAATVAAKAAANAASGPANTTPMYIDNGNGHNQGGGNRQAPTVLRASAGGSAKNPPYPKGFKIVRELNKGEMQGCKSGKAWTRTPQGIRNCTIYTDQRGRRVSYIWVAK